MTKQKKKPPVHNNIYTLALSLGNAVNADRLDFDRANGTLMLNTYHSMAVFSKEEAAKFGRMLSDWSKA